jgi:hypothetical protein
MALLVVRGTACVVFLIALGVAGVVIAGLLFGPGPDEFQLGPAPGGIRDVLTDRVLGFYLRLERPRIQFGRVFAASAVLPVLGGLYWFVRKRRSKKQLGSLDTYGH